MTKDQLLVKRVHWPKVAMFAFAIVLPAVAVGISNKHVFAKAFAIATIGLIVTVGITLISTYFAGNAAPKTRRYAMFHDLVIAIILCVNFLFHFQIAREISAAEDARTSRREDVETGEKNLDRSVRRQKELAGIEQERLRAETEKLKEQRRVIVQLPANQRGRVIVAPAATPTATAQGFTSEEPAAQVIANAPPKVLIGTPEEIRASWFEWLFWAAAAEIFAAILGGMILMIIWQWDVNGNGLADDEERLPIRSMSMSPSAEAIAARDRKPPQSNNVTFSTTGQPPNSPRQP